MGGELYNKMEMFDRDLEEQVVEEDQPNQDFKPLNFTSATVRSFSPFTPFPPSPTALSPFPESGSDCSLDQQLQRNNAAQLKKATLAYLRACTEGELEGCADGSVLWGGECGELEGEEDATAEGQVRSNPLLHHWRKKQFLIRLRSHEELRSWLVESRLQLGKGLAQEVTLVAATLCEGKLDQLMELQEKRGGEEVIPRMQRFWGDEGQENLLPGGWGEEGVSYEDVQQLAARAAEDAASQLSTSRQLQLLNLPESSEGKFAAWVGFVTENLFLSLVGVAQREEELEDFTRRMALPDADELVPAKRVKID